MLLGSSVEPTFVSPTVDATPADPLDPREVAYYPLTANLAQCWAAERSSVAQLLTAELRAEQLQVVSNSASSRWRRTVLQHEIEKARNQSAADALTACYQLYEVEGQQREVSKGLNDVADTLNKLKRLRDSGQGLEEGPWFRQQLDLREQDLELAESQTQLNKTLRALLEVSSPTENWRFWPDVRIDVVARPESSADAVAFGLARHPELRMLRRLASQLDADSLPAARQTLSTFQPLLGQSPVSMSGRGLLWLIFHRRQSVEDLPIRRQQLQMLISQRESQIAEDIRSAVAIRAGRFQLAQLAQLEVESWQRQLLRLKSQLKTGQVNFLEVSQAQLNLVKAHSELLSRAVAWQLSEVKVKHAQGILAEECGLSAGGTNTCSVTASPASAQPLSQPAPALALPERLPFEDDQSVLSEDELSSDSMQSLEEALTEDEADLPAGPEPPQPWLNPPRFNPPRLSPARQPALEIELSRPFGSVAPASDARPDASGPVRLP